MGSTEAQNQIPFLDFSGEVLDNIAGERWRDTCSRVRDALETHGCFVMFLDDHKIPKSLHEEMLKAMDTLFDLPEETKNKYVSSRPYRSYLGKCPIVPLHESFGIDNEPALDAAQAFTNLMWPQGNPIFCETLKAMSSKMVELNYTILKMILESFGTGELFDSYKKGSTSVFRLMKYRVPSDNDKSALGLVPHTDKNALTILCQNDVQGLQFLNKDGVYVPLMLPYNSFLVIVGDSLKAWSNARLKAPKHRVVMSGNKERYSFGLFSMAKEGVGIEVPNELVDYQHPLLYRPFIFSEFMAYFVDNISDDALEIFAGINLTN